MLQCTVRGSLWLPTAQGCVYIQAVSNHRERELETKPHTQATRGSRAGFLPFSPLTPSVCVFARLWLPVRYGAMVQQSHGSARCIDAGEMVLLCRVLAVDARWQFAARPSLRW